MYYALECTDCKVRFPSVLATSEQELLQPYFDDMAEQAGTNNAESFERFFSEHQRHSLEAVKA